MTLSFEADCVLVKRSPTGARQATGSGAGRVVRHSCGAPYDVSMAEADGVAEEERAKPTLFQRMGMKELRRKAGKGEDEPLSSEDWELLLRGHEARFNRAVGKLFLALPRSPRCGVCGAPFAGVGQMIVGPLGFRPSRKNPHICATCVELSPPGGMKAQTGILFADL